MRTSRLPHVQGSQFVQIHAWALDVVGLAGAAVIGVIDYKDRVMTRSNQAVTTRADLIASLQGLVGRDAVDSALRSLVRLGWIIKTIEKLKSNPAERYKFALNPEAINAFLETGFTCTESRNAPSGSSTEEQFDNPEIPNNKEETEEEPPPVNESDRTAGGGFCSSDQTPEISCQIDQIKGGAQSTSKLTENFMRELNSLIPASQIDSGSLKRIRERVALLCEEQQTKLMQVLRLRLKQARDPVALIIGLVGKSLDGTLSTPKEVDPDTVRVTSDFLTNEDLEQHLKGMTAVFRDGVKIATVRAGCLFDDAGARFAITAATKIVRGVQSGKLTMV